MAMILKGLPESYKQLAIHITQSAIEITFTEFKSQLRSFEETEQFNTKSMAHGIKTRNIAVKQGTAEVTLKDVSGRNIKVILKNA